MNSAETSRLHVGLLQALRSIGASGLDEASLATAAHLAGFDLTRAELGVELRAVSYENLIAAFTPLGGKRWRITALGESKLAEAGL